jgi:small conductance mechanosensitive channel
LKFSLIKGVEYMDLAIIQPKIQGIVTLYGLKIVAAVITFILGRWIAKALRRLVTRAMKRGNVDDTLISFLGNLTYVTLLAFVIIAAINQLGVQTTSFIAILGAAGLAVGLALPGFSGEFCRRSLDDNIQAL